MNRQATGVIVFVATLLVAIAAAQVTSAEPPGNQYFFGVWQRTDQPVRDDQVTRTWMWGPEAFTPSLMEDYAESPGGQREVQYYDKSRMEITQPTSGDPNSVWFVTNGLLVNELMTGQLQLGDNSFRQYSPAEVNVGGDPDDVLGPTYASMAGLRNGPALPSGSTITQTVDRNGNVSNDPSFGQYNVTAAQRVQVPGIDHQVASVFWDFMNSTGLVIEDGQLVTADLFVNPYFATGFPVTEAYWLNLKVAGSVKAVLVQCFERRCLTYTPSNAPEWRVEQGNVGQHYYRWRYEQIVVTPTATQPDGMLTATTPAGMPTVTDPPGSATPSSTNEPTASEEATPTTLPGNLTATAGPATPTVEPSTTSTVSPATPTDSASPTLTPEQIPFRYICVDCPKAISGSGQPTVETHIEINEPVNFNVADVDVTVRGNYQPVSSLRITLISPAGTAVVLYDRNCGTTIHLNLTFDDQAADVVMCPPDDRLSFRPEEPLSALTGESVNGTWTLRVQVVEPGFGAVGSVEEWDLWIWSQATD